MPTIVLRTRIRASQGACFDLSLNVDTHSASQSRHRERAIAGVTTGMMRLGDEVTWEAHHLGKKRQLASRITAYERPHRFVDEMVRGDFRSTHHEHIFEVVGGGTRMTDHFSYEVPFGVLGQIFDRLYLRRYMRRLLEQRNAHLKAVLEGKS